MGPKTPEPPSSSDLDIYRKFISTLKNKPKAKEPGSIEEAKAKENDIFDNKEDKDKIIEEIFRIKRYIMDNDVEIDFKYLNDKLEMIHRYNKEGMASFAKVYLYILEQELLPDMEPSFKSVDYIAKKYKDNNDNNNPKGDILDPDTITYLSQFDNDGIMFKINDAYVCYTPMAAAGPKPEKNLNKIKTKMDNIEKSLARLYHIIEEEYQNDEISKGKGKTRR